MPVFVEQCEPDRSLEERPHRNELEEGRHTVGTGKRERDDRDDEVPDATVLAKHAGVDDAEGDEAEHLPLGCRLEGSAKKAQGCQRITGEASTAPGYRLTVGDTVKGSATPRVSRWRCPAGNGRFSHASRREWIANAQWT
jgi:hypothetical protein